MRAIKNSPLLNPMATIAIDLRPLATPYRTGIGEYTAQVVSALLQTQTTHTFVLLTTGFTLSIPELDHWRTLPHVKHVHIPLPNKIINMFIAIGLPIFLDIIIKRYFGYSIDLFFSPNFGFTRLSPHVPHVLTVHDLSFVFFPQFFSQKQYYWHTAIRAKKQCQTATHLIPLSENTKRDLIQTLAIPPKKITVVYPGSPTTDITPNESLITTVRNQYHLPEKFVLFLATIEPRKNIPALITGWEMFCAQNPNHSAWHLVIAGAPGWKNAAVFAQAKKSPLHNRLHIIHYVAAEHKTALLHLASVVVYPSFYEGFGFPALEAMAAGTPVIVSDRSSLPEVVGEAGMYINPHRPAEIAEALAVIYSSEATRQKMIAFGIKKTEQFSWEKTAQNLLAVFDQTISSHHI